MSHFRGIISLFQFCASLLLLIEYWGKSESNISRRTCKREACVQANTNKHHIIIHIQQEEKITVSWLSGSLVVMTNFSMFSERLMSIFSLYFKWQLLEHSRFENTALTLKREYYMAMKAPFRTPLTGDRKMERWTYSSDGF